MNVKWKDKKCQASLIRKIKTMLKINEDGSVSQVIGVDVYIDSLFSHVEHRYNLDSDVVYQFFKRAVLDYHKDGGVGKPGDILSKFKSSCDEFIKNKKKYVLVTSISVKNNYILKARKVNGCYVRFRKDIPAKYIEEREKIKRDHLPPGVLEQEGFLYVLVSVNEPDVKSAFKSAIGVIDIIRAVFEVGFKKKHNFLSPSKDKEYFTDSLIKTGRVHTLHSANGKCIKNGVWYEPDDLKCKAIGFKDLKEVESHLNNSLRKVDRSPFKDHLLKSLKSYITALDQSDQAVRFMNLSVSLEILTKSDQTKMIIKRVAFFYQDREINLQLLTSLRDARNNVAHSGVRPYNVEMKNYLLCGYINHLLIFFIENPFRYDNFGNVIEFISLPTGLETIDQQISNLENVKRFIGAYD